MFNNRIGVHLPYIRGEAAGDKKVLYVWGGGRDHVAI